MARLRHLHCMHVGQDLRRQLQVGFVAQGAARQAIFHANAIGEVCAGTVHVPHAGNAARRLKQAQSFHFVFDLVFQMHLGTQVHAQQKRYARTVFTVHVEGVVGVIFTLGKGAQG